MVMLLYIALGYLAATTCIFLLNRRDFGPLLQAHKKIFRDQAPSVSVCIPARNEEGVIARCVRSALQQEYPSFEVIVLDDESTDQTSEIVHKMAESTSLSLKIISGKQKPVNWLGKPWACQQLADQADGDILMFIDADTWLEKDMVANVVRTMGHDVIEFLTIWPMQKLETFWEKTVIPLVYYALLSMLPARYVYKVPKWLPKTLRQPLRPLFAAACGQCIAFKRSAYDAIGGHKSVKNEVVEDVALAKQIKKSGFKMKMYHGEASITCRMYTSGKELKQGFGKNFLAGFDYNIPLFVIMALLHLIIYVFPFIALPIAIVQNHFFLILLSAITIVLILFHRILLARWFNWNILYSLLHPLAVLWFQKLAIELVINYVKGEKNRWKGRTIE